MSKTAYHEQLATEKRAAIMDAATALFGEFGYDGTSLSKIAAGAGVSKATLFKQFPTKAELFEAMVIEFWRPADWTDEVTADGHIRRNLITLGRRYVTVLSRPGMAELFRIVIAEAPRFPELAKANFELGKQPFWRSVHDYLRAESGAGALRVDHPDIAATQFLGMIADNVFWPRLLLIDWRPSRDAVNRVVSEAAETMVARYAS
ncbi:TetR/AcrR family transcriptional regulator [Nocardia sp. NPDC051321]|uniref:TetR/AcrR family transcriptional regulator n=1 Tax=Nocardia sp. NPDC051321 TaxID=3364323 RepID=UPI0037B29ADD